MRLSDVLSKPPSKEYVQVDEFLKNKKGKVGQKVDLYIGNIALNYYCLTCDDIRTFYSKGSISCIFVNKKLISIDCVLICGCGEDVQVWFLVESDDDITSNAPRVRIIKKTERLSKMVLSKNTQYGEFTQMIEKANQAYRDNLGAGAIVYLRKIFEMITIKTADALGLEYKKYEGGNPKNFSELLKRVNEESEIIPKEFSSNGYKLFQELSAVVHGNFDEEMGVNKFEPLLRLVLGILDNVKNKKEFDDAMKSLGWKSKDSVML